MYFFIVLFVNLALLALRHFNANLYVYITTYCKFALEIRISCWCAKKDDT